MANFETLLGKQNVKFNSLQQSIEELEVRLATARSLSTSDQTVEDSGEGTFETATDGSPEKEGHRYQGIGGYPETDYCKYPRQYGRDKTH